MTSTQNKELSARYVDAYPHSIDPRARRYARLDERQLAALVWVEELLATEPQDSVAAWIDERLAAHLMVAWLAVHESSLGAMTPQALAPLRSLLATELTRSSSTTIMPLESFSTSK